MKTLLVLASTSILALAAGCSRNHPAATTPSTPSQSQPASSSAPARASVTAVPTTPLPSITVAKPFPEPWRPEPVDDHLGGAIVLKRTSLDGKYDLVIVEKGTQSFPEFAKHGRWESVYDKPAKGQLMNLRLKFEDGQERQIEWDELAYGTDDTHAVLWSYPAGVAAAAGTNDAIGGDKLLMQELMKHRTMLLEVEPGVTTQFDLSGLGNEMAKIRPLHTEEVLSASQSAQ